MNEVGGVEWVEPGLELKGSASYPRRNGQPQFAAPWQSRAFGMAMAMNQGGALDWEAFRERLIERIAEAERAADGELTEDGDGSLYYERWMAALTEVLVESGVVGAGELTERTREYRTGARREVY